MKTKIINGLLLLSLGLIIIGILYSQKRSEPAVTPENAVFEHVYTEYDVITKDTHIGAIEMWRDKESGQMYVCFFGNRTYGGISCQPVERKPVRGN